jgi:hypothetical protein
MVFHNKKLHAHSVRSWLHTRIFFEFLKLQNTNFKKVKKGCMVPWCQTYLLIGQVFPMEYGWLVGDHICVVTCFQALFINNLYDTALTMYKYYPHSNE